MGLLQLVSIFRPAQFGSGEHHTPSFLLTIWKDTNSDCCDAHRPFKPSGGWKAWDSPMKVGRGECMWQVNLSLLCSLISTSLSFSFIEQNFYISWEGDGSRRFRIISCTSKKLLIRKCTRPWCAQRAPVMSAQEQRGNLESVKKATRPLSLGSLGKCSKWRFQGQTNELINYSHFTRNMVWFFLLSWIR